MHTLDPTHCMGARDPGTNITRQEAKPKNDRSHIERERERERLYSLNARRMLGSLCWAAGTRTCPLPRAWERRGAARRGAARRGVVRCDAVRCEMVRCGAVRCGGAARCGAVRGVAARRGAARLRGFLESPSGKTGPDLEASNLFEGLGRLGVKVALEGLRLV